MVINYRGTEGSQDYNINDARLKFNDDQIDRFFEFLKDHFNPAYDGTNGHNCLIHTGINVDAIIIGGDTFYNDFEFPTDEELSIFEGMSRKIVAFFVAHAYKRGNYKTENGKELPYLKVCVQNDDNPFKDDIYGLYFINKENNLNKGKFSLAAFVGGRYSDLRKILRR